MNVSNIVIKNNKLLQQVFHIKRFFARGWENVISLPCILIIFCIVSTSTSFSQATTIRVMYGTGYSDWKSFGAHFHQANFDHGDLYSDGSFNRLLSNHWGGDGGAHERPVKSLASWMKGKYVISTGSRFEFPSSYSTHFRSGSNYTYESGHNATLYFLEVIPRSADSENPSKPSTDIKLDTLTNFSKLFDPSQMVNSAIRIYFANVRDEYIRTGVFTPEVARHFDSLAEGLIEMRAWTAEGTLPRSPKEIKERLDSYQSSRDLMVGFLTGVLDSSLKQATESFLTDFGAAILDHRKFETGTAIPPLTLMGQFRAAGGWKAYLFANQDLYEVGIRDEAAALKHWLNYGRAENRSFDPNYSSQDGWQAFVAAGGWQAYVAGNPDIFNSGVQTADEAYQHWAQYGIPKARSFANGTFRSDYHDRSPDPFYEVDGGFTWEYPPSPGQEYGDTVVFINRDAPKPTGWDGRQLLLQKGDVFNLGPDFTAEGYRQLNQDVAQAIDSGAFPNFASVTDHYVKYGFKEGRLTNNDWTQAELEEWNDAAYLAANPDVNSFFMGAQSEGWKLFGKIGFAHYLNFGRTEGRPTGQ